MTKRTALFLTLMLPAVWATGSLTFNAPFAVYTDYKAKENHYIPSGWMGDYRDIRFNERWDKNPRSGNTAIRVQYSPTAQSGAGWAGIYWQNPANNWGSREGGYNLNGANMLVFWARGEKGDEKIADFRIGGIKGDFGDSAEASTGPIELTKNWTRYEIKLSNLELSNISGGFCWVANRDDNPEGATFYLDDIQYE